MSATSLSKSLRLSSTLKMEEETINMKKQGIVSILGSDSDKNKSSSLRRTLSADMSSAKWITQHGFSPMKKIASSEELSVSSSITDSEDEEEEDYQNNKKESSDEPRSQFDIWTSIISQKEKEASDGPLPPPYIHPLVKSSSSSLSEKSLEICTESLGSETGSEGFSSYSPSETGTDLEEDKEIDQEPQPPQQQQPSEDSFDVEEDILIPKYNYNIVAKKYSSPQRSFPPPIPSLSRGDGASILMQSRRDNGRLVLEAVSVPTTNNFLAQRQDGRLVLTFIDTTHSGEQQLPNKEEEEEDVFDNFEEEEDQESNEDDEVDKEIEEEEEEEEEEKEMEFGMERQPPKLSSVVISLHRLTLVMNKKHYLGMANKKPTWPNKFNEVVKFDEGDEIDELTMVAQSLPPPQRMARMIPKPPVKAAAAAATAATSVGVSFNAYEYYWRPKPGMATKTVLNPMNQQPAAAESKTNNGKLVINSKNPMENYEQKELLVLRGKKGNYLVPALKSCKEPRRSLLFWEPHCIATS